MNGHIISIIGGKGGVGKSVFAANLAVSYLQNFKQRPLIMDLDLRSLGDQSIILGLNPVRTVVEVSKLPPGPIDSKVIGQFLTNAPAGYSYIAAPKDHIVAQDLDVDGLARFYKALPHHFPFIVVDCGSTMDSHVMKTLEHSTAIFVVCTPDVIVLNQTKRILAKIQELLFPPEMVQVILNRYSPQNIISPQMIQKTIGRTIFAAVPEDTAACDGSLAKRMPVCIAAPNAQVSRGMSDLVRKIYQTKLLERLAQLKRPEGLSSKIAAVSKSTQDASEALESGQKSKMRRSRAAPLDAWTAMKRRIHRALVEQMDMKQVDTGTDDPKKMAVLREKTKKVVLDVMNSEDTSAVLSGRDDKAQMVKEVLDEALALGPLEDLLTDTSVTEIMVNSRDQIYVERNGKPQISKVTFTSEEQMRIIIDRILQPLGRRVDEKAPYVDARLADGSRVHVIIPPLALRGPTITIRKFPDKRITAKEYIQYGTCNQEIVDFLRACIEARLNVIVSGGTGSGKTTLLNVLSNFIPSTERIITVEDSAELQLGQEHVVRLESRPQNIEGEGEVGIRDLVKCCLRMRPDRIVVGECRGGEAIDMLQAMSTGHDGSLTTVHANNPKECLSRLETLVTMADLGLPSKAIREIIASAVNLIVHISRLSDGTRKVTHITEIGGMQGDVVIRQDIFIYKQEGLDKNRKVLGRFVPTGYVPKFVEDMEKKGMKLSSSIFAVK